MAQSIGQELRTEVAQAQPRLWARWRAYLLAEVDGASLAVFRTAFGLIMAWEVWRYFSNGWIARYYIEPTFFFSYLPLISPWPGDGMYRHFLLLGLFALLMALGLFYRIAAVLFFLGFSYVFLLDKTQYLNHFYLISLVSFLLALIPAQRAWSLDALPTADGLAPGASSTVPRWSLHILRFQIALVYFFGGIAKLNEDWLAGEPVASWVAARSDLPLIGPLLIHEYAGLFFAFSGLAIDLSLGFLLIWGRTFWLGALLAIAFNLTNAQIFSIGIFPYFMIAALVLFPRPDWPRLLASSVRLIGPARKAQTVPAAQAVNLSTRLLLLFLHLYVVAQILIPLRHWAYPGDVAWTEEGHRFSWRMKLRDKQADVQYYLTDPLSGRVEPIHLDAYLTPRQISKLGARPDMILQFAHELADRYQAAHGVRPRITADVSAALNNRPPQPLIDPAVDLAAQPINLWPAPWILPLDP